MAFESRLRRSLLFVPGDAERKLDRAVTAGADTLILDLEDAVAPDQKDRARGEVAYRIRSGFFRASEVAVRINARGTEFFEADLASIVTAGARLLVIPKTESAEGIEAVARAVAPHESAGVSDPVRLLALVETARGVAQLGSFSRRKRVPGTILRRTDRLDGLCFGNADFSLDMGIGDGNLSGGIVYHARCNLAIAAVAAGVIPIDGVCLTAKDDDAFRNESEQAARLGFEGKLCIHPSQVPIANEVFTPTRHQIRAARRVVDAWRAASANGQGVISLDGKMVDAPQAAIQARILERARRAGALSEA